MIIVQQILRILMYVPIHACAAISGAGMGENNSCGSVCLIQFSILLKEKKTENQSVFTVICKNIFHKRIYQTLSFNVCSNCLVVFEKLKNPAPLKLYFL